MGVLHRKAVARKIGPFQTQPAIVISGFTMGLGVIRALSTMGVPVIVVQYDSGDIGQASKYVTARVHVSHPERSTDDFLSALIAETSAYGRGILIPTSDASLKVVSQHKEQLERHHVVACPDWRITQQFIDKAQTYRLAEAVDVPAPKTLVVNSLEEIEERSEALEYPCLVKPCESHQFYDVFKTKMIVVYNRNELVSAYRSGLDAGMQVVVQEWIPGEDSEGANYNAYFDGGEPLVEFTAKKVRSAPRHTGSPCVAVSVRVPEVLGPGRNILRAMNYSGYACVEFKHDCRDNTYKLMEVNGRHNLSTLLAVHCGLNFPWIQYHHLTRGELPIVSEQKEGLFWVDVLRDLGYGVMDLRQGSWTAALRPYICKHVDAIFDWRDPFPFLKRCVNLLRSGLRSRGFSRGHAAT